MPSATNIRHRRSFADDIDRVRRLSIGWEDWGGGERGGKCRPLRPNDRYDGSRSNNSWLASIDFSRPRLLDIQATQSNKAPSQRLWGIVPSAHQDVGMVAGFLRAELQPPRIRHNSIGCPHDWHPTIINLISVVFSTRQRPIS